MTYTVNLTGHGADAEDAKGVFEDTVRALRRINAEGPNPMISGSISGSAGDGTPFAMNVDEVEELDEADGEEVDDVEEEEEDAGNTDG